MWIRFVLAIPLILAVVTCSGPTSSENEDEDPYERITTASGRTWQLVWNDEFDRDGMPDGSKWQYDAGYIANNEEQYYTIGRPENSRIEGGHLTIEARQEPYTSPTNVQAEYTSARLKTEGRAAWTYGRIEVRARLPRGRGMWPAIWMLGTNISQVGWPTCGEIDIMEHVGFQPTRVHANIHTRAFNHTINTGKGASTTIENPYDEFHVYAVEWLEDRLEFFVDGRQYFAYPKQEGYSNDEWPFDKPHFLILNAAVGGDWGGQQGIDDSIFPTEFVIDYVRVYEQVE